MDYENKDPNQQYTWQGSVYSSTPAPQNPIPPQNPWQAVPAYSPIPEAPKPVKEKKPVPKGVKVLLTVLVCILCCALVSGTTLAVFVDQVNRGNISLVNTGTVSDPLYIITKVTETPTTSAVDTGGTVKSLTTEEISKKILPSIVCIQNYQVSTNNGFGYFGQDENSSSLSPAGEGSGIIASTDGYIITNAHVVEGATSLKVITYSGETYEAKLIGSDSVTDLAVLKIEATDLTPAEFGSSADLSVGDMVVAAGNPGGSEFSFSITVGYVSALNRAITSSDTGYTMKCIQTDAAVNPGNSGGALVNEYGQVVGIVSSKIVSTSYEGLSFAIPVDDAQSIVTSLKTYGYVKDRAVLGVSGGYIDSMTARFYGLTAGYYINEVTTSNAQNAGLRAGDVITAVNGTEVTSSTVLSTAITALKPGDTITLSVSRASTGGTLTVEVTLSESTGA